MLDIRILGPLEVHDGIEERRLQPQAKRLLALLAVERGSVVTADRVADLLGLEYGGRPAKDAHTPISRLRRALSPYRVVAYNDFGYQLQLGPELRLDAEEFAHLLSSGKSAADRGEHDEAVTALEAALALWRGPPLCDLPALVRSELVADSYEAKRIEAHRACGIALRKLGRHADAVPHLTIVHQQNLRDELVAGELMLAYVELGRRMEALSVYQAVLNHLRSDWGALPGPSLTILNEQILRGDPNPVTQHGAASREAVEPPAARYPPPPRPLRGRREEQRRLVAHLDAVANGAAGVVCMTGEPGMGTTALAATLLDLAEARGVQVFYGSAGDAAAPEASADATPDHAANQRRDGPITYRAFVEALQWHVRSLFARAGPSGPDADLRELSRLIPTAAVQPLDADPDWRIQQLRLFQAFGNVLRRAAGDRRTVLVLDDMQWADGLTEELVCHVIRSGEIRGLLLVLANCRPELLSRIEHVTPVDHIELGALDAAEAETILRDKKPDAPSRAVQRILDELGGNPLYLQLIAGNADFIAEFADVSSGEARRLPDKVLTHVVTGRVDRMSERDREVLEAAAVIGRDFDLATLLACAVAARAEVFAALKRACATGLVREHRSHAGRYSFTHAVVCSALYQSIGPMRGDLHLRAAEALERRRNRHVSELAHHYWHAREFGDVVKAVRYNEEAARLADRARAWSEAARCYARACESLELLEDQRGFDKGTLLLQLGQASDRSGTPDAAKEAFARAADLARENGDGGLLAAAALGYGRVPAGEDDADDTLLELLSDARRHEYDSPLLRAHLMAKTAVELVSKPGHEDEAEALAADAVALARSIGDPLVLSIALAAHRWTLRGPHRLEERTHLAWAALRYADESGDRERRLAARHWLIRDLLAAGEVEQACHEIARFEHEAAEIQDQSEMGFGKAMRATVALLRGDWAEGERLTAAAGRELDEATDPDAQRVMALHRFMSHAARERFDAALEELEPLLEAPDEEHEQRRRPDKTVGALAAWAHAELGNVDAAAKLASDAAQLDMRRPEWLVVMSALARVAVRTRDTARVAALERELEPFRGQLAVAADYVYLDSVDGTLDALSALLRDAEGTRTQVPRQSEAAGHGPGVAAEMQAM